MTDDDSYINLRIKEGNELAKKLGYDSVKEALEDLEKEDDSNTQTLILQILGIPPAKEQVVGLIYAPEEV